MMRRPDGQGCARSASAASTPAADVEDVGADLLRDADARGATPVAGDERDAVRRAREHRARCPGTRMVAPSLTTTGVSGDVVGRTSTGRRRAPGAAGRRRR